MKVHRICGVALTVVFLFSTTTAQATYYYCVAKDGGYHSLYITDVISLPDRFTALDLETCMGESFNHDFACPADENRTAAIASRQMTLDVYRDWNAINPIGTHAMDCHG